VALGDPVGPPSSMAGLIRLFLERCDDFAGVPVFYEVSKDNLHHYADFGLAFVKLGEEARVDLTAFTLEGGRGARFRQVIRRLEKDGGIFRIIPAEEVPGVVGQLREVSDDWLKEKSAAEKGFSLGFFDAEYLSRFPVAVVERDGRIVAFANLWLDADRTQLSLDLMRFHRNAPRDVMEALFVHVMRWGKQQGARWFALGMAPLSGFETSPVATFWNRLGAFVYHHGGSLYNFQGLRAYKQKFNPEWQPRYLAYPGGMRLARILADVSALIAGGYRHIFRK
jgi:phosphatidylglycerol lysyltransferase